jgi:hypothetical protein
LTRFDVTAVRSPGTEAFIARILTQMKELLGRAKTQKTLQNREYQVKRARELLKIVTALYRKFLDRFLAQTEYVLAVLHDNNVPTRQRNAEIARSTYLENQVDIFGKLRHNLLQLIGLFSRS